MSRLPRVLTILWATTSGGCGDWPRFANLPAPDAVGVEPPEALVLTGTILEPAAPGWPDTPAELPASTQGNLGGVWEVTRLSGTLSPFGGSAEVGAAGAVSPFEGSPVAYADGTDVDWVHLWSDGGPLCLILEIQDGVEQADALVYRFDPDTAAVDGTFLNPPAANDDAVPGVIERGVPLYVAEVPLGPLAVYVAGVTGPAAEDVPYVLHVVSTTVAESCQALTPADVTDLGKDQ